jgi:4'-phosphopantetheinyl transferase
MIPAGEIHLWYNDLATQLSAISAFEKILTQDELKYARSCQPHRQREFIVTRSSLRILLSHYFPDIKPEQWQFFGDEFGKPKIVGPIAPPNFHFNLSHSDARAAYAFSADGAVGVDIERIDRDSELEEIANAHFSDREIQDLKRQSGLEFRAMFFRYWTLKEAVIKALGKGVAIPLNEFTVSLDHGNRPHVDTSITVQFSEQLKWAAGHWQFLLIGWNEPYQVATAVRCSKNLKCRLIEKGQVRLPFPLP